MLSDPMQKQNEFLSQSVQDWADFYRVADPETQDAMRAAVNIFKIPPQAVPSNMRRHLNSPDMALKMGAIWTSFEGSPIALTNDFFRYVRGLSTWRKNVSVYTLKEVRAEKGYNYTTDTKGIVRHVSTWSSINIEPTSYYDKGPILSPTDLESRITTLDCLPFRVRFPWELFRQDGPWDPNYLAQKMREIIFQAIHQHDTNMWKIYDKVLADTVREKQYSKYKEALGGRRIDAVNFFRDSARQWCLLNKNPITGGGLLLYVNEFNEAVQLEPKHVPGIQTTPKLIILPPGGRASQNNLDSNNTYLYRGSEINNRSTDMESPLVKGGPMVVEAGVYPADSGSGPRSKIVPNSDRLTCGEFWILSAKPVDTKEFDMEELSIFISSADCSGPQKVSYLAAVDNSGLWTEDGNPTWFRNDVLYEIIRRGYKGASSQGSVRATWARMGEEGSMQSWAGLMEDPLHGGDGLALYGSDQSGTKTRINTAKINMFNLNDAAGFIQDTYNSFCKLDDRSIRQLNDAKYKLPLGTRGRKWEEPDEPEVTGLGRGIGFVAGSGVVGAKSAKKDLLQDQKMALDDEIYHRSEHRTEAVVLDGNGFGIPKENQYLMDAPESYRNLFGTFAKTLRAGNQAISSARDARRNATIQHYVDKIKTFQSDERVIEWMKDVHSGVFVLTDANKRKMMDAVGLVLAYLFDQDKTQQGYKHIANGIGGYMTGGTTLLHEINNIINDVDHFNFNQCFQNLRVFDSSDTTQLWKRILRVDDSVAKPPHMSKELVDHMIYILSAYTDEFSLEEKARTWRFLYKCVWRADMLDTYVYNPLDVADAREITPQQLVQRVNSTYSQWRTVSDEEEINQYMAKMSGGSVGRGGGSSRKRKDYQMSFEEFTAIMLNLDVNRETVHFFYENNIVVGITALLTRPFITGRTGIIAATYIDDAEFLVLDNLHGVMENDTTAKVTYLNVSGRYGAVVSDVEAVQGRQHCHWIKTEGGLGTKFFNWSTHLTKLRTGDDFFDASLMVFAVSPKEEEDLQVDVIDVTGTFHPKLVAPLENKQQFSTALLYPYPRELRTSHMWEPPQVPITAVTHGGLCWRGACVRNTRLGVIKQEGCSPFGDFTKISLKEFVPSTVLSNMEFLTS